MADEAPPASKPAPLGASARDVAPKRPMQDFYSPYYLHPSDHPGLSICSIILKGPNYKEWSDGLRNAFKAKRKLRFIDGQIPKPTADPDELDDWYMVNSMLIGWILQTIDPSLRSSIPYSDDVATLWNSLRIRFSVGNGLRKLQLRSNLGRCRQNGQSVSTYFGIFQKLQEEINTCSPLPSCDCGKCTCSLNAKILANRNEDMIHHFLLGLDDVVFGTLRSNILAQDLLPDLDKIYALAIQEERHRNLVISCDTFAEFVALAERKN